MKCPNKNQEQTHHGCSEPEPDVSKFEAEAVREVIGLQTYIRKSKVLNMMKNVLAQERHEKELANQRA